MIERTGIVTFKGKPLTLLGEELKAGDKAPDFTVTDNDFHAFSFADCRGKICLISSVHSLDSSVCDRETRRFNEEASKIPQVMILTISMDLPFAQKRWCGAAGITSLKTLSDYREASFGLNYGVLIKENGLLARAVFLVDKKGIITYTQLVSEIATEPDYDALMRAVREVV